MEEHEPITHGETLPPIQIFAKWIANSALNHWKAQLAKKVKSTSMISHTWRKPQTGWFKCKSDCRFTDTTSSSAFLVRNCNEYFCTNALVAELYSIRDPCILFNAARLEKIIYESDSLNAILFINDPLSLIHWAAKQLVDEIRKFWALWPKLEVQVLLKRC